MSALFLFSSDISSATRLFNIKLSLLLRAQVRNIPPGHYKTINHDKIHKCKNSFTGLLIV